MGQAPGACRGQESKDPDHEVLLGRCRCCEDTGPSPPGQSLRQPMSGTGGTDEDVLTPEEPEVPSGGLSGMAMSAPSGEPGSPPARPLLFSDYELTVADLLDTFSICSRSLAILAASLEALRGRPDGAAPLDASQLRAVASVAAPGGEEAVLPRVTENLAAAAASGVLTPALLDLLGAIVAKAGDWVFDSSGRVDAAPRLTEPELLQARLSQETVAVIRRIACPHVPAEKHGWDLVRPLRAGVFGSSSVAPSPHVVITIGAPGAGKTYCMHNVAVPYLRDMAGAPALEDYVRLDPDVYISKLLDNNNEYREMANFLNHESFMCAVGQRRHVLFDHTGKDLLNTCGRVISRFREANYKVHILIVITAYSLCRQQTADRLETTGRAVAESYTRSVFQALQTTVPWYLENHSSICDTMFLFKNRVGSTPTPMPIETEDDVRSAVEFAKARLAVQGQPQKGSKMPASPLVSRS